MPLTDTKLRGLKPVDSDKKFADSGGLFLLLTRSGSKLWRYKFRLHGKEGLYAIGSYPQISLSQARLERDKAKALVKEGKNPTHERKQMQLVRSEAAKNTFESVAKILIEKMIKKKQMPSATQCDNFLKKHAYPYIGKLPLDKISTKQIKEILDRIDEAGTLVTASRVRFYIGQVFRLGITCEYCEHDPTFRLRNYIDLPPVTHHRITREPQKLYRDIESSQAHRSTQIAIQLTLLTAQRSGVIRRMRKDELFFEIALWVIPAHKMKMKRTHIVPLPKQAIALIEEAISLAGDSEYVFPSCSKTKSNNEDPVISIATMPSALRTIEAEATPHGLRGTFSTILHENLWPHEWIEMQLAHDEGGTVSNSYNQAKYLDGRKAMMAAWADWVTAPGTSNFIQFKPSMLPT